MTALPRVGTPVRIADSVRPRLYAGRAGVVVGRNLHDREVSVRLGSRSAWLRIPEVLVHPFRSNWYTRSGVLVHPSRRAA